MTRLLSAPAKACYSQVDCLLSSVHDRIQTTTARVHSTALATRTQLRQAKTSTTSHLAPVVQAGLFFAFTPFLISYHAFLATYHTLQTDVYAFAIGSATRAKGYLYIVLHPGQWEASRQIDLQVQYLRKQVTSLSGEVEARGRESRRLEVVVGELRSDLANLRYEVTSKGQEKAQDEARLTLLANDFEAEMNSAKGAAALEAEARRAEYARLEELSIRLQAELEDTRRSWKASEAVMENLQNKIRTLEAEKAKEVVVKHDHVDVGVDQKDGEKKAETIEESMSGATLNAPELPSTAFPFPKTSIEGSPVMKDHRRVISFNGQHLRSQSEPEDVRQPSTLRSAGRVSSTSTTSSRRRSLITRVRSSLGLQSRKHSQLD